MSNVSGEFDQILNAFLASWPVGRLRKMTLDEYCDLSNKDSLCYWLEYGSVPLGAIGGISLNKFELWKLKDAKEFKDNRFNTDGTYAWNAKKGDTLQEAMEEIRRLLVEIASASIGGSWKEIDTIQFNSIGKWKLAFMYSDKRLLPIYSKRALIAIAKGLGRDFPYATEVSKLQLFILNHKVPSDSIEKFAFDLYVKFAKKRTSRNYYIIGSKYGDENGDDVVPKIKEFLSYKCVAIGFLAWLDFSPLIGADRQSTDRFVDTHWKETSPVSHKIRRYFHLLSQLKEGDIIAVKSHGAHNQLTIIAYAEVVMRNGSIYEHRSELLGHHVHVEFLDAGFYKPVGLTYAETIHRLSTKEDAGRIDRIFGWYADDLGNFEPESLDSESLQDDEPAQGFYNEKSEVPFLRSASAMVTVNLVHSRIQNSFFRHLAATYPDDLNNGERNRVDATRETKDEVFIYEIKPYENVYSCIREGVGQLLDYSHRHQTKKNKRIVIVGPNIPSADDLGFINMLKSNLNIPFMYIAFNEKSATATEY